MHWLTLNGGIGWMTCTLVWVTRHRALVRRIEPERLFWRAEKAASTRGMGDY
jgi:hypothetical protein